MNLEQYFINEQSDFYAFMVDNNMFKSKKTYHDYISRLRYVSGFFKLDKTITKEDVAHIMAELRNTMDVRSSYNTIKGVTDIGSGLKKFLEYAQSDYRRILDETILAEERRINNDKEISETEKVALVKSRIGQGAFRSKLLDYWGGCSVTQCQTYPLLVASHIKPWRKSDNAQRLDVFNGLLLTPNLDKLFDKGYISFDKKGLIICSDALPASDQKLLGISPELRLSKVEAAHQSYLEFHRNNCLL